jgi:hypothetical protein
MSLISSQNAAKFAGNFDAILFGNAKFVAPVFARRPSAPRDAQTQPAHALVASDAGAKQPAVSSPDLTLVLSKAIFDEFVDPAVRTGTADGYLNFLQNCWPNFVETLHALHVVIARSTSEKHAEEVARRTTEDAVAYLCKVGHQLAGSSASDELEFAAKTYLASITTIERFHTMPPRDRNEDRQFAETFAANAALHLFGVFSLFAVSAGVPTSRAVIDLAFQLVRNGALRAYASARGALKLRLPDDQPTGEEGVFDGAYFDQDDFALADATTDDENEGSTAGENR